jgi:transcriptional regulator with XRE-family HTH domain
MSPVRKHTAPAPGTIGWRIRQVRRAWGWTQVDLATRLNTGQQVLSNWEKNIFTPSATAMVALAGVLGLSVEALATGKGFTIPDVPQSEQGGVAAEEGLAG